MNIQVPLLILETIQSDGRNPWRMMKLRTLKFGGTGLLKICGRTFKGILRQGKEVGVDIMMMMTMNISVKMDWKLICLLNLFEKIEILFKKIAKIQIEYYCAKVLSNSSI